MKHHTRTLDTTILLVETTTSNCMIQNYLGDDYSIIHSPSHSIAYSLAIDYSPSLIIIEVDISPALAYTLCKKFKDNRTTASIPVLFYVNSKVSFDPCYALKMGAMDYITTPIDSHLLKAKVANYIGIYHSIIDLKNIAELARELNPNTALPGNTSIANHITEAIGHDEDLVVVYADLDNFKAYNDKYSFSRGDLVIKLTAEVIKNELEKISGYTFLGHIGGDDFVFIAPKANINEITENIIHTFDLTIKNYYTKEDRNKGYITAHSRSGKRKSFPIMTISMGGVDLVHHQPTTRYEEVSDLCAEVKSYAKTFKESCFFVDRRHTTKPVEEFVLSFSNAI